MSNEFAPLPPCFGKNLAPGEIVVMLLAGSDPIVGAYVRHDLMSITLAKPCLIIARPGPNNQVAIQLVPFGVPFIPPTRMERKFSFNVIIQIDQAAEKGLVDNYIQMTSGIQRAQADTLDRLNNKPS